MRWLQILLVICTATEISTNQGNACQYPGCTCTEVTRDNNVSLTCTVTNKEWSPIEKDIPGYIVSLSLRCPHGQDDLGDFVDRMKYNLQYVRELTIQGCVTSLSSALSNGRFADLRKLVLDGVILKGGEAGHFLNDVPLLKTLQVTNTLHIAELDPCDFGSLSNLNLSGNAISGLVNCTDAISSNVTIIDLSHNNLSEIPALVATASRLTELYLQDNNISSLRGDNLQNATRLTKLDLSSNNLISLPKDFLTELVLLEHLNLSRNHIKTFPSLLLSKNTNLTVLDLSYNNIKYLSSVSFKNLVSLTHLYLSSNAISFITSKLFSRLASLQWLDVGNNSLMGLPELNACRELLVLDARSNMIQTIRSGTFRGLKKLQGVSFRYNKITIFRLADIAFSDHLNIVDFSYNSIKHIDTNALLEVSANLRVNSSLSVLKSVEYLLLNNNMLTDLYQLAKYFTGLKYLIVYDNQISRLLTADIPRSLERFDVSYNQLGFIQRNLFISMPYLRLTSLQGNFPHLFTLPKEDILISPYANPKPEMYISANLYICDCHMAYLKAYHSGGPSGIPYFFQTHLPVLVDLDEVMCITERDDTQRRLIDVPEEEFTCSDKAFCERGCNCCRNAICPCNHPCPQACSCHYGGSGFGTETYWTICDNSSLTDIPSNVPPLTNNLHAGENNITVLRENSFSNLTNLICLFLQDSNIQTLEQGCFRGLASLTKLHLEHNQLSILGPDTWEGLKQITHLYLQYNQLRTLSQGVFLNLKHLEYLDLGHNLLTIISESFFLPPMQNISIMNINILNNILSCDCKNMRQTVSFVTLYANSLTSVDNLTCFVSEKLNNTEEIESIQETIAFKEFDIDSCNTNETFINRTLFLQQSFQPDDRYVVPLSVFSILAVFVIVACVAMYLKRHTLQAWMFVKFGVRIRPPSAGLDETGTTYDAFVSYSSHDERLVVRELAPRLEEGVGEKGNIRRYQLCLHYRDFPVGDSIADTIMDSIDASKRTIILLSDNFLASEWCRFEFQTAHHHVLKERSHRLIIVLLHDIEDEKLDPDLRIHLKAENFLRYDDPWFWEKLYFALPDVPVEKGRQLKLNNLPKDTVSAVDKAADIDIDFFFAKNDDPDNANKVDNIEF